MDNDFYQQGLHMRVLRSEWGNTVTLGSPRLKRTTDAHKQYRHVGVLHESLHELPESLSVRRRRAVLGTWKTQDVALMSTQSTQQGLTRRQLQFARRTCHKAEGLVT